MQTASEKKFIELKDVVVKGINMGARATSLKHFVMGKGKIIDASIPILNGVSFTAHNGDKIAFVGSNGSGKSSLLKVLAGIYPPLSGTVTIHGQVAAIIEMGLGFEAEMTGRENIKLALVYNNMLDKYSKELEEQIIEFSELGGHIDLPLKGYSSGMTSRLAFSISMLQKPDILLLDEVFAVGDSHFVEKAKKVMTTNFKNTPVAILVSHSEAMIREMCNRAILLQDGKIIADGTPDEVYKVYNKC